MPDPARTRPTPARLIDKWSDTTLSERAASQEHFIDLCHLLGQPTPADHDSTGAERNEVSQQVVANLLRLNQE